MAEAGLILAYVIDKKGHGKKIGWEDLRLWRPEDGLLWLHLSFTSKKTKRWLAEESGLDQLTQRALITKETRPIALEMSGGTFVHLRGVNLNPGDDPDDMVSIRLWYDKHRIISTRRRKLQSVHELRKCIDEGRGPKDANELVLMLNEFLTERMTEVINRIESDIDNLEEHVLSRNSLPSRELVAETRRKAISFKRYLAPQREALFRLQNENINRFSELERMQLRESCDRILRHLECLETIRERAAIIQEEIQNTLSEQLEKRIYVLSVVSLIFLPLSFLTGLLGINVGGIPGVENPLAFEMVCGGLGGLGLLLLIVLKIKRWI